MKKEGLKKLFFAEKQDLKTELKNLSFFLVFILLNENVFPQIPINGFCKFNNFKVDTGFTKLQMINFNSDGFSDLLLFNPSRNEALLLEGAAQGEFTNQKKTKLPLEINFIHPLNYKSLTKFAFTNRKKRKAGLYEFDKSGKPVITKITEFDSYPEFINTADVNLNGRNEILISGGAFNGVSLLYQDDKLIEKNIIKGGAFSQAAFMEINNDGYIDIAAYDLINREFGFYYNNSEGDFRKARSIPFNERPSGIKTFDLNLDLYEDLIFSTGSSINIWYGDFRSSYENKKRIETNYKPDKYIYGDFNKDGLMDLVYFNAEKSVVSVLFAKNEFDYYPEIIYLMQSGLKDIIPFYSRFIDGIAALSSNGDLYTITHITSFTDDVNISIGAKPGALSFFDNENNGITDFCFVDEYDNKIKFIVRDNTGVPGLYFSQQLAGTHKKIISENLKAGEKNYICFSYDKKLIEVVRTNFSEKKISKTALYSPGSILDLKVRRVNDDEYKIFIVYELNESLNSGVFDFQDLKFNFSSQKLAGNLNLLDASLGITGNPAISYWSLKKDRIFLYSKTPDKINEAYRYNISLEVDSISKIISFTGDLLNTGKNITISFLNESGEDLAVISGDTIASVIKRNEISSYRITSKNDLFFGESKFNGLKKLFINMPEINTITMMELKQQGKNIDFIKLIDTPDINSFFIKNMTLQNYHIVYSDQKKNCITIKRLRG